MREFIFQKIRAIVITISKIPLSFMCWKTETLPKLFTIAWEQDWNLNFCFTCCICSTSFYQDCCRGAGSSKNKKAQTLANLPNFVETCQKVEKMSENSCGYSPSFNKVRDALIPKKLIFFENVSIFFENGQTLLKIVKTCQKINKMAEKKPKISAICDLKLRIKPQVYKIMSHRQWQPKNWKVI